MKYSIDQVPGFLLHDGISWCRKMNRARVKFFRAIDGNREEIIATPAMMLAEIIRRQSELKPIVSCAACGGDTDGRCYIVTREPLCEPCYWAALQGVHRGPVQTGGTGMPAPVNPTRGKVLMLPELVSKPEPHEETPEEIAARLGVSLDVLQANGYFD